MAKFTIQKTVKDGKTSIEILTPTVEPLVMHYNSDARRIWAIYALTIRKNWHLRTVSRNTLVPVCPSRQPEKEIQ